MKAIPLTPIEEVHRRLARAVSGPVETERVPLRRAAGRVLRGPVRADRDLPPFNRSAMDGYAVRSADFDGPTARLREIADIPAGVEWRGRLRPGCCARIMTGAPAPAGADAVAPVEFTRREGEWVAVDYPKIAPWRNIHRRAADARKGRVLLRPGCVIDPGAVNVAASVGAVELETARLVRVGVISTGREVVPPSAAPSPCQIRDANGPALMAALAALPWCKGKAYGIAADTEQGLRRLVVKALAECDVVVLTGGVSMGDYDLAPKVLREAGVREILHGAAIRPGKPLWFGRAENGALVFGLPGNPVSTRVGFREFVGPTLRRLAGFREPFPPALWLPLAEEAKKKHRLTAFSICRIESDPAGARVRPTPHEGSGDFVAAAAADGVFVFPAEKPRLAAGEMVEFHAWSVA